MKTNIIALCLVALAATFASCNKEEDLGSSNIKIETPERTELDKWLYDNFVVPYNIEIKYRWDYSELDIEKKLVPPLESMIKPYLQVVKDVWIAPYSDISIVPDKYFLKKLSPKQFILVGSLNYNTDGTVTLGTAEGGRKIVLYDVNAFDKGNKSKVLRMLQTMQHEFAHILHQNKLYPLDFKFITPNYTATWKNYSDSDANSRGYITSYARSGPDDDFAEMVSTMLTMSKAEFDALVDAISNADGKEAIRKKEAIVAGYFRDVYNINIYQLQQRIAEAMNALSTTPDANGN